MRDRRVLVKPKHARLIYELHKSVTVHNGKALTMPDLEPLNFQDQLVEGDGNHRYLLLKSSN